MKIALLGATGFVGSAILKEALERGHSITAVVRDTGKLEKKMPNSSQKPATFMIPRHSHRS
jgi:uncharacterized protein